MIKVLHIVTQHISAETILRSKLAALGAYDDLHVTAVTGPPPPSHKVDPLPVRHLIAPLTRSIQPLHDLHCVWHLRALMRRERFDVVHTHVSKAGVVGAVAARLARVPLILHTFHGLAHYAGQPRRQHLMYRSIEQLACRLRHHAFSQNLGDIDEIVRLMRSPDKVTFEGNGVDVEHVLQRAQRDASHGEHAYPDGGLRIALVSRLEPVKRVDDFLDVCARLQRDGMDFAAVIAGPGSRESQTQARASDLGIDRRVRILGWSPHVPALLAAADIVVLASEKEGLPRSLMEAMTLEKPVVATHVPGTREVVVDGETGFLTSLGDVRAMAEAIKQLAADPDLRRKFGIAAKARVDTQFNDKVIAGLWRDFYIERLRTHDTASAQTSSDS